jgi:hypothetical protein
MKQPLAALFAVLSLSACAGSSDSGEPAPEAGAAAEVPATKADARATAAKADGPAPVDVCAHQGWYADGECDTFCSRPDPDCAPASGGGCDAGPPAQNGRFVHGLKSPGITALGDPAHSLSDAVAPLGERARMTARFRYGRLGFDLEDEGVGLWVRTGAGACGDWAQLGRGRTDDEGRVQFDVPGDLFAEPGRYTVAAVVDGDGTRAEGAVYVVAPGQPAVVFDIDGTLTTSDSELFQELFTGSTPDMWPGASDVANLYADAGYLPVFLTGRPESWAGVSRTWLAEMGFPEGVVRTTDDKAQVLPTRGGVGAFKRAVLEDLQARAGLRIVAAYGNAPTDICAYAEAGLPSEHTFIVGPHAGEACDDAAPTQPITDYRDHAETLSDLPPAE